MASWEEALINMGPGIVAEVEARTGIDVQTPWDPPSEPVVMAQTVEDEPYVAANLPPALVEAERAGMLPPGSPGALALEALRNQYLNPWPSPDEAMGAPRLPPNGGELRNSTPEGAPRGIDGVYPSGLGGGPVTIPADLLSAERAGLLPAGSPGARALEALRAAGGVRPASGPEARPFPGQPDYRPPPPMPLPSLPSLPSIAGPVGGLLGGAVNALGDLGGFLTGVAGAIRDTTVAVLRETLPTVAQFALGLAESAAHSLDWLADHLADATEFAGAIGAGMYEALDGVFGGLLGGLGSGFLSLLFAALGRALRGVDSLIAEHGMSPVL